MKTTFEIQNLKCHGCANTIMKQLSKLDGIADVLVDTETNEVHFNYSTETVVGSVKKKLADLGYPLVGETNSLPKKAKSYVSCAVGRMTK